MHEKVGIQQSLLDPHSKHWGQLTPLCPCFSGLFIIYFRQVAIRNWILNISAKTGIAGIESNSLATEYLQWFSIGGLLVPNMDNQSSAVRSHVQLLRICSCSCICYGSENDEIISTSQQFARSVLSSLRPASIWKRQVVSLRLRQEQTIRPFWKTGISVCWCFRDDSLLKSKKPAPPPFVSGI